MVGVTDELRAARDKVAQRLRELPSVEKVVELDAADPEAGEQALAAQFQVVLLGGRTGGTEVLAALLARGALGLKLKSVDFDGVPVEELAAARALRQRRGVETVASIDEMPQRAVEWLVAELKQWRREEPGQGALLADWEHAYLRASFREWEAGPKGGLRARAEASGHHTDRAQLYVSLRAARHPELSVDGQGRLVLRSRRGPDAEQTGQESAQRRPVIDREAVLAGGGEEVGVGAGEGAAPYLEQVLSHPALPHLVIEGEAGAGKTVLLQHVAYALAARHLGEREPLGAIDFEGLRAGAPLLRIPLLVEARRLGERLREGRVGELFVALEALVEAACGMALPRGALREGLRAGRYLLLVDSLDEVPEARTRERVVTALEAAIGLGEPFRMVLTTRPMAHTGVAVSGRLRLVRAAPMDDESVGRLVTRWAASRGKEAAYESELHG